VLVANRQPLTLKLSDFGLAAHVHPDTRLLRAAGTIRYQPPEAAWGYATEASDLYAVALILFEMLTGMPAFAVDIGADLGTSVGVAEALRRSREAPPTPPSRFRARLPPGTDELLVSALAPRPEDRFRTASAFAEMINTVAAAASPE
jgi:serine/threonine protein kinase